MRTWEYLITTRRILESAEIFNEGSIFGELELNISECRKSQLKAKTDGKVYVISKESYFSSIFAVIMIK